MIAPLLRKKLFLREYEKYTVFVLLYFSFFPVLEGYYYVSTLLIIPIEIANLNHNGSVKDKDSSMTM